MILEALIVIALCTCWYWYTRSARYRIGNFPSPPAYFLLGHAPYINSSEKTLPFLDKYLTQYDGIMKIHVGTEAMLVISNHKSMEWIMTNTTIISKGFMYGLFSEWLGESILLATGSHWKSHRKILTPAFHFKRIDNLISVCQKNGEILVEQMSKNLDKESLDVYPIISNFALDVVCESSMATSVNAQAEKSDYRESVLFLCKMLFERAFDAIYMHEFMFSRHPKYPTYKKSIKTIHEFDEAVIDRRRKLLQESNKNLLNTETGNIYGEKKKTPFLDILLQARDENGEPLTDKEIRDEVDGIMFAEKVYNEQKEVLSGKTYSDITYNDLNEMKYLDMVIKESLRLYPPAPTIARRLQEDTYFEGKLLPKKTTILIMLHHLHHNAEVFPNPEVFDPERFGPNSNIPNFAFLPFSAGLRNCIGQKFALLEIKIAVIQLLRNFIFLPAPSYEPKIVAEVTLKSSNGIRVKLKKRLE